MHATILATSGTLSRTAVAMCCAGIAVFVAGALRVSRVIARAQGPEKIVTLGNLCFAVPLAVFGALHVFGPRFVMDLVPAYMPWRSFWVYAVGGALLAASLSIATDIGVRWSGLLFGIMMFSFVAMIHLPGALANVHDRVAWTIVFRETSFGGAGWLLAGAVPEGWRGKGQAILGAVGRVCVTMALVWFGIEHFLYPTVLPGVPLTQQMPAWVPGRTIVGYLTGTALLLAGGSTLSRKQTRTVATLLGAWLLLLVLVIYGPFLVVSLAGPEEGAQIQGINYFADTLLFAGVVLALARATPPPAVVSQARISPTFR
jgi:hypothetical protein